MKEIQKVVQKLSREQKSVAGRGGGGVRTGVAFWDCSCSQIVPTASAHARNKVLEFEFAGGNLRTRISIIRKQTHTSTEAHQ